MRLSLPLVVSYVLASLATCPLIAPAAPTVYDGFSDYADGPDILTTSGGFGFAGSWGPRDAVIPGGGGAGVPTANSLQLLPSSLSYIDTGGRKLQTSGGSMFLTGVDGNAHVARTYDLAAIPHPNDPGANPDIFPPVGATTYISFLAKRSGPAADPSDPVYGGNYPWGDNLYPRVAGVNFWSNDGDDTSDDAVPLHIGNLSNQQDDVWQLRGQDLDNQNPPPMTDQPFGEGELTYFVLFKIDHSAGDGGGGPGQPGGDRMSFYLNPQLAGEGLNTPDLVENWEARDDPLYLPGHWLSVEVGNASSNRPFSEFTFDEFRIGNTWADVTPFTVVPEPTALALGLASAALLIATRRRS